MSCNCNKAFSVPVGVIKLNLGVYESYQNVFVIFETATGRTDVIQADCDVSGNIIIPTPDLRLNTPYQVTIAESNDPALSPQSWKVGGETVNCISLQFVQQWQGNTAFTEVVFQLS